MKYITKYIWSFKLYILLFLLVPYTILPAKSEPINPADKEPINLLIVHSFEETMSDYRGFNKLIAENLKKKKISADTHIFYLDCDAYDKDGEIERINHYLDTTFTKPDIILVTDDQATYSLLASNHPLLKTLPIVFSGVNFPNWDLLKEYPNAVGIWDNPDYEKNIEMIEKLMGVKSIRFFYDKTFNGKRVIERLAEQFKGKDDELYKTLTGFLQNKKELLIENKSNEVVFNEYLRGNDYEERPLKTSLHFINMWDDLGRNLLWNISGSFKYSVFLLGKYDFSIVNVGRLATVPTFSAVNKGFTYHQDILGGYFTPLEEQVEEAVNFIARSIDGEKIAQLPLKEIPKKYLLDWAVLNRWGISLDEVPEEYEIVNMPFYVKYQTEAILFSSVFMLAILSLIVYLLFLYRREAKRKRKAQMDLWEEKEFLSLAMEGSNIFAWKYNNDKNVFTFDKEFSESVGIDSKVVKLEKLIQMIHPDEREHTTTAFINMVNGNEDRGDIRARMDFNRQGYVWYEYRFLNTSGVLGDKSSMIGLIMNIQEYKNKEQELITARDLASKAELKQSFLANMSHEIRTPLNAIVGFSNILVSDDDLPNEDKNEYIRIINKNCELLLKLINDILEISRIESGNLSFTIEPCNVNDVIEDVYNMCYLQVPENVAFIKNVPQQSISIDTDCVRLKQVLVNFVGNAFKFTSSGSVTIGMEIDETKKEICLYVEDTGEGIPEEHQKMIFERFYKVNEFVQGTGLGLSISQVIINKLNGRITLSSEVNKGSRFGIILPINNKPTNHQENKEEISSDTLRKAEEVQFNDDDKPVILIAEDSVSNYMILNNILKKSCNILWAINGQDVLEILKKQKVDLILMDIKMDKMDGITALIKLRKNFKNLPVIIQTAYAFDENRKLAKQAGASGFIAKPISPDILIKTVDNLIKLKMN